MLFIIIFFIALTSGFFQSMTGFGYSVVSMTTLPMIISPLSATTISGIVANLQSVVLSFKNRKCIRYKVVIVPLIVSIIFSSISISIIAQRPSLEYKRLLGIFLVFIAIYLLFFNDRIKIKANLFTGTITGIISGVANGLFGMGAPPTVMYMMSATRNKEEYISTIQFNFLMSGIANTIARIANGGLTSEIKKLTLISIIGMLIGGYLGSKIFHKLSQKQIGKFVYGFMIIMGVIIAIKG